MDDRPVMIMVTTGGRNDAERLGEGLVVEHLAGCCTVIPMVHSFYYWDGQLKREHESLLLVKTIESRAQAVQEYVRKNHTYELPEIIQVAIDDGRGRDSGGKRRQRKRANRPKERKPEVEPVRPIGDDLGALATAVAAMAAAEAAPQAAPEANGHEPAVPPAVLEPVTEPAPEEEFTDLLGQAVGLRLDSVSREFGHGDEMHVTALKDISMQIGPCEFVSIVGPSGCGKTTLLSLMGGLDKPTSGHVYAAGLPVDQLSDADLANYRLDRGRSHPRAARRSQPARSHSGPCHS